MANFTPSKKTPDDFNNGVKYVDYDPTSGQNGDEVQAKTINDLIESQLYVQGLTGTIRVVTNNPEANPTVEIETLPSGLPQFVFYNIKGDKGEKGSNILFVNNALTSEVVVSKSDFVSTDTVIRPNDIAISTIAPYRVGKIVVVDSQDNVVITPITDMELKGEKGDTPSLDGYATETYVDTAIENAIIAALNANYGG